MPEEETSSLPVDEAASESSPGATGSEDPVSDGHAAREPQSGTTLSPSAMIAEISFREISMIWLAGVILLGGYLLAAYVRLWIKVKKSRCNSNPEMLKLVEDSQNKLGMSIRVEVREAQFAKAPFVTGAIKPKLVLPCNINHELSRKEMEHIILHELSHVKQKDLWVIWLTAVLQVLHWFNPVLWYAFYRMKSDCEIACDAYVLKHLSADERNYYGHTIINLMEAAPKFRTIPGTTGIANNGSNLRRRIQMISQFKNSTIKFTIFALALLIIGGCVSLTDPQFSDEVDIDAYSEEIEIENDLFTKSEILDVLKEEYELGEIEAKCPIGDFEEKSNMIYASYQVDKLPVELFIYIFESKEERKEHFPFGFLTARYPKEGDMEGDADLSITFNAKNASILYRPKDEVLLSRTAQAEQLRKNISQLGDMILYQLNDINEVKYKGESENWQVELDATYFDYELDDEDNSSYGRMSFELNYVGDNRDEVTEPR